MSKLWEVESDPKMSYVGNDSDLYWWVTLPTAIEIPSTSLWLATDWKCEAFWLRITDQEVKYFKAQDAHQLVTPFKDSKLWDPWKSYSGKT